MVDARNAIYREVEIAADPATVFAFLTDSKRLIRWIGVSAILEPRPGGLFLVDVNGGAVARGEFEEVIPVSRLAYSWGREGSDDMLPGSSLVEIDLVPRNGGTLTNRSSPWRHSSPRSHPLADPPAAIRHRARRTYRWPRGGRPNRVARGR
jgi:uncharacterized protein YndB with AHSA1/START domain